jgi:glucose/arabinose dehydrogenase
MAALLRQFLRHRARVGVTATVVLVTLVCVGQPATGGTSPDETVPSGKGRTPPPLPTTGTTLPAAPGTYRLVGAGRAEQPVGIVTRPADGTMYLVEKIGRVRAMTPTGPGNVVLDLRNRVVSVNEQGMLGLAFHPTDATRMFVNYTERSNAVVVAEFRTDSPSAGAPIAVNADSERVLLKIAKPFKEHNAGTLIFDRTGALLIAIGDGGSSGDPKNNAQRTDTLLGKVLRITVDPADGKPYGIPADNPFATTKPTLGSSTKPPRPEVFAYGLRNPWRISLDRGTGDVWVPDVGESKFEEVNRIPVGTSGQNFGWKLREGRVPFAGGGAKGMVNPVHVYAHADRRCSIIGGFIYRGSLHPQLVGWYLFADVCSGEVMALNPKVWKPTSLGLRISYPTSFGEGPDGELWLTSLEGPVARLAASR